MLSCTNKEHENPEIAFQTYLTKGNNYIISGKLKKAIKEFERATEINPTSEKTHFLLGRVYHDYRREIYKDGHRKDTYRMLNNPKAKRPRHEETRYYKENQRYQRKAVDQYKTVIKLNPKAWLAHYLIASDNLNNKQYDEAIEGIKKVIELNPEYLNSYSLIADAFFMKKKFALAKEFYEKAISLDSTDESAYFGLALTHLNINEGKKAWAILQHLKSINSTFYVRLKNKISGGRRDTLY